MPITPDFKRFDLFRSGKIHIIRSTGHFVATERFTDAAGGAPFNTTPNYKLENPVSHIKAIAGEYDQDAVGNAFFAGRLDVIVGTTDLSIAGLGWSKTGSAVWTRTWLDEGDILVGPFEYVEVNTSTQDEELIAYEIIQ